MKTSIYALLIFLMLLPPGQLLAQQHSDRLKIGLALSGGGARGSAHIGVLKALEELNVQVDYVAGTSMGSIIGGLYASGYSADEISELLVSIDWDKALSDKPARENQTMRKKELDADFLIPYRVGVNNGGIQLPLGVIQGQHLDQIFARILKPVMDVRDFDQLHIPFRAVATDLVTGEEVVLSEGSLSNALRASMSVPGVFAPVLIDGRMLVDGGMANNLPINVVRDMGAEIVIAVDISSPLLEEDQLNSVLSVTEQLSGFLTRRNTEAQIASLGPQDILLVPQLDGFSSANFNEAVQIVDRGHVSAMEQRDVLLTLSTDAARHGPDWADAAEHEFMVHFIEIDNDSVINDEIIRSRLKVSPGETLNVDLLETSLDQIYSLDVFQSVTYDMIRNEAGETGLLITANNRSWGPNYLQLGLEFSDDFSSSSEFRLGAAYTRNALNSLGGELRVVASLGREDELRFDFYQPIDEQAKWFVQPRVFANRQRFNVFEDEDLISEIEISGFGAKFGLGHNFSTTDRLIFDYEYFRGEAREVTGGLDFDTGDVKIGDLLALYQHDSLDNFWFPKRGWNLNLAYRYSAEALGASTDYHQAMIDGSFVKSFGKNTFLMSYQGGYSFDDKAPIERWYRLGGFGRLSGLLPNQISGRHLALGNIAYMRELTGVKMFRSYAGMTLEAGNVWNTEDDVSFGDLRYSSSIFVGAATPLGPLYLAWGYSEGGDSALYFYLGNPWRGTRF